VRTPCPTGLVYSDEGSKRVRTFFLSFFDFSFGSGFGGHHAVRMRYGFLVAERIRYGMPMDVGLYR
jgi:hypothetical protein